MHQHKQIFILLFILVLCVQIKTLAFQQVPKQQDDSVISSAVTKKSVDTKVVDIPNKALKTPVKDNSIKKVEKEVNPAIAEHPWAVYFVLIAAGLAAIASIASSTITGLVTWKSKDKEYKNDFYKKVIDKRIKAVESAEQLISLFSSVTSIEGNNNYYHSFFDDSEKKEKWEAKVDDVASLNLWYSKSTSQVLMNFTQNVSEILQEIGINAIENDKFLDIFISKYESIENQKKIIENSIDSDMRRLYDIDAFFKMKLKK